MAARTRPGKPPLGVYLARNCGLFRGLLGSPHALRQRRREIRDRIDGPGGGAALGIEAAAQGIDQRGADHRAVGILGDGRPLPGC